MKPMNVLFLCTGNSARSIMAEAYLNRAGKGRFAAYSAGSYPQGTVNPFALDLLKRHGIDTGGLRSKGWDEFARPGAPVMDIVLTVCDQAAGELCPVWPGQPVSAHWGVDDPAKVVGSDADKRRAFVRAYAALSGRINLLIALPPQHLERLSLARRLAEIGRGAEASIAQ
jgi:protein-tyrosine-phosphatase